MWCGLDGVDEIATFKCKGSLAASFTIVCKDFNFLDGDNAAHIDDPCGTHNKVHKQSKDNYDMEGQQRTEEDSAEDCRERCRSVKRCKHYSYWPDGGCHLQDKNAYVEHKGKVKTGPPICCAVPEVKCSHDLPGHDKTVEKHFGACQDRCRSVSDCAHFTFWDDGGCHLAPKWARQEHDDHKNKWPMSGQPWCIDEALTAGTTIALYSRIHKRFLRMTSDGVDASAKREDGTVPDNWNAERFTVVDAGAGQVAFHSALQNRFLKMNDRAKMDRSGVKNVDALPGKWAWERFTPVDTGIGGYAFHNAAHNRYVRMAANRVVDASGQHSVDFVPDGWTWEDFTLTVLAPPPETTTPKPWWE